MKKSFEIYCHSEETVKSGMMPIKCCEVSFLASPEMLRIIAEFLRSVADEVDSGGSAEQEHFHLQDMVTLDSDSADVIVVPTP